MDDDQAVVPNGSTQTVRPARWRELWQVPVLAISVALIAVGLWQARRNAPQNDFDGALDQVERLLVAGQIEEAGNRIKQVIEPKIGAGTPPQQARFHALAGDWLSLRQEAADVPNPEGWTAAIQQYELASGLGLPLDTKRLTRQALAAVALGDLDAARRALDAMASASGDATGRDRAHAIVQRRIIDVLARRGDASRPVLEQLLSDYRTSQGVDGGDEAWAAARLAEIRLRDGRSHEALDRLLVDMRRVEPRLGPEDSAAVGELYTLLGEAHYQIGEETSAEADLKHALELLPATTSVRGRAEATLGLVAAGRGDLDDAVERFSAVVRDYVGDPLAAVGLLGRAEALAALGDHMSSQDDYRTLAKLLKARQADARVTRERVAESLMVRHDAALTQRLLPQAAAYISIAESLFAPGTVPASVLLRLAAVTRLQAEAEVAAADAEGAHADAVRGGEAARLFNLAGEHYLRHAKAVESEVEGGDAWTESVWMAADSFDRAGQHQRAAEQFQRYLDSHPAEDARAAEAQFRLAQALLALEDFEQAARAYRHTIDDYPASPFAARSYVPLARCLDQIGNRGDALAQLRVVLDGGADLQPESMAYRNALIAYGALLHESGDDVRAVEALDEAVRRYPDDERLNEIRFRLGDSYRRIAALQRQRLDRADLPPADRQAEADARQRNLMQAMTLFDQVVDGYQRRDPRSLDPLQRDSQRLAYLYRADAAFDLGRYEDAIALYDQAERRYSDHPVSMVALIQIVNCWHALGEPEKARTAHRRAEIRLAQLPPDAFESADSILDRASWERWLANTPLDMRVSAGNEKENGG
ncbi:MAG: tetratricopeptide repeat protein [Phycisphaerales bacterium]|nr:tetratricopeptide repeat protein [Phycisphaerales bacterium]